MAVIEAQTGIAVAKLLPHERIMAVARELFCRDGIHATGIDRILSEAGASKMTLYARFGSKEALVRAVLVQEGAERRQAFFNAVNAAAPDAAGRLRAVMPALRLWLEGERFYGCAFVNAAAEHSKGAVGEPWLRTLTAEHHGAILSFLGALAAEAGFAQPEVLARQVLLIMDGAVAAAMVGGNASVLDVAGRTLDAVLAQP